MTMNNLGTLLFVSPRFLFPLDAGGKIRTTQILRGMKGGRFRIHLLSPGSPELTDRYRFKLQEVCDDFEFWPLPADGVRRALRRSWYLLDRLPISARCDLSRTAAALVSRAIEERPSVSVFDFLHSAVLAPARLERPTVLFTHNVESEIFERQKDLARNPLMRGLWANQHRKMLRFEGASLRRFDVVVSVSDRDASTFKTRFGIRGIHVVPTGVDLDFFGFREPTRYRDVVFCGSMDWLANQDGVKFFMERIWPRIASRFPGARMTVVGRAPPASLISEVKARRLAWTFTGFVEDVRPIVSGAAVSVIPLRIGGGTRLKVYESMAMGPVVVSTSIGVEGLPVESGRQCLVADEPDEFADAVVTLLQDPRGRGAMAQEARRFVEQNFGHLVAAHSFEQACIRAMSLAARA